MLLTWAWNSLCGIWAKTINPLRWSEGEGARKTHTDTRRCGFPTRTAQKCPPPHFIHYKRIFELPRMSAACSLHGKRSRWENVIASTLTKVYFFFVRRSMRWSRPTWRPAGALALPRATGGRGRAGPSARPAAGAAWGRKPGSASQAPWSHWSLSRESLCFLFCKQVCPLEFFHSWCFVCVNALTYPRVCLCCSCVCRALPIVRVWKAEL